MSTDLYVVKSRRTYNGVEATSVLSTPSDKETARKVLASFNERYQEPGNYYIEKWESKS